VVGLGDSADDTEVACTYGGAVAAAGEERLISGSSLTSVAGTNGASPKSMRDDGEKWRYVGEEMRRRFCNRNDHLELTFNSHCSVRIIRL
jgi:hypothetical protein